MNLRSRDDNALPTCHPFLPLWCYLSIGTTTYLMINESTSTNMFCIFAWLYGCLEVMITVTSVLWTREENKEVERMETCLYTYYLFMFTFLPFFYLKIRPTSDSVRPTIFLLKFYLLMGSVCQRACHPSLIHDINMIIIRQQAIQRSYKLTITS